MVDVVRREGIVAGRSIPREAKDASQRALARLEEWKDVSFSTDFKA